ncbi:ABC transporter ATP-binding protein [Mesomycoplasma molare]|nr:ABC transporter ATP-binding protein [Mesomycoplasma molare]
MKRKLRLFFINKKEMFTLILLAVLKSIILGISFLFLFKVFDNIINNEKLYSIFIFSLLSLLMTLFNVYLNYLYKIKYKNKLLSIIHKINNEVITKISNSTPKKLEQKTSDNLLYYSYELPNQFLNYFYEPIFLLIEDVSKIIILLFILFYFHWIIGIVCLLLAIILILYFNFSLFKMTKYNYKNIDLEEENRYNIEHYLKIYEDFFFLNKREKWFRCSFSKIKTNQLKMYKNDKKFYLLDFLNQIILSISLIIPIILIATFSYYQIFNFTSSIFLISIITISFWLKTVVDIYRTIPAFKIAKDVKMEMKSFININKFNSEQEKNINFQSLEIRKSLLANFQELNLKLNLGEKLLITGKSGIGKSMLLKLITKSEELDYKGEIFWNDINIKLIQPEEIVKNITFLDSNNIVLQDSIINNITLYEKDYNIEEVKNILKILDLDIDLNLNAKNLSEGQKQKILLARVIFSKKQKIIILDETFNNIDKETAKKVREIIMKKSLIYIEVSHNLDLEKHNFDKVIELKDEKDHFKR